MATEEKVRRRVAPRLPEDERYVVAFPGLKGISPRLPGWTRIVAVTDRRVHVFKAKWWRIGDPGELLTSLPPGFVIEPERPRPGLSSRIVVGGERLWVTHAWRRELAQAVDETRRHAAVGLDP